MTGHWALRKRLLLLTTCSLQNSLPCASVENGDAFHLNAGADPEVAVEAWGEVAAEVAEEGLDGVVAAVVVVAVAA